MPESKSWSSTCFATIREVNGSWWLDICVPFNDTFLWQETWFYSSLSQARRAARRFPNRAEAAA